MIKQLVVATHQIGTMVAKMPTVAKVLRVRIMFQTNGVAVEWLYRAMNGDSERHTIIQNSIVISVVNRVRWRQ
jgi:hypothetical protein